MFHRRTARRCFNSQPPEGGCTHSIDLMRNIVAVSTHSRSKAAALCRHHRQHRMAVSTHSRSKAAARWCGLWRRCMYRFNSQPLEGGCPHHIGCLACPIKFQLTAARRRLLFGAEKTPRLRRFQLTAARRRLRVFADDSQIDRLVSTHSRSKAAAAVDFTNDRGSIVSTHSRSKAAAYPSFTSLRG